MVDIIKAVNTETIYSINITQKELDVIVALTGSTGGKPDCPVRLVSDPIYETLKSKSPGYASYKMYTNTAYADEYFKF